MKKEFILVIFIILVFLSTFVSAQSYENDEVTGASVVYVPESSFPYNALASLLLILAVLVGSMFALRE